MTEDTRGFIALQDQITRLSQRLSLIEKHTVMPAEEPAENIPAFGAGRKGEVDHLAALVDELRADIAGRKGEVDHLAALVDELRADIARKDTLIKVQAQTIKSQVEKIAKQDRTIDDLVSDLRADRDVYADNLVRRISAAHADNHRVTSKLAQIHRALRYKGDVHPQEHLNQVRRVAGVSGPTRRFR